MMKKFALTLYKIAFFCLMCAMFCRHAHAGEINRLRLGQTNGTVRIVFDATSEFDYNVFLLDNPKRLVVDTENISVAKSLERTKDKSSVVGQVRVGKIDNFKNRIVFDLQKPVVIKKAFMLSPQSTFNWRLAIDVAPAQERDFRAKVGQKYAFSNSSKQKNKQKQSSSNKANLKDNTKKIVVIDAGHGGHDPGAIGFSGVYEKNITLATAKELKRQLDKEGKYKVFLTRSTDVFIPLRQRVQIARKYNADLFISIHADSATNRNAKGLSVYTLSEKASDKEAAALAERENKADVISGLNMVEQSKEVSDVLISLAQRETRNRSSELARCIELEMKKSVQLISDTHRFAGFAVLKAPDVPSVLLEMGYLSNKNEERLLRQESYRRKIATSAVKAINRYFDDMKHKSLF
ncbi:MAG: N-acetylmuramoyl-L-alanine amidase [Alphaproteobacteria bacterium]|nr:N-acetylmuramoyl-L-alanine amidase [Alphaproteobacteria bacterium]